MSVPAAWRRRLISVPLMAVVVLLVLGLLPLLLCVAFLVDLVRWRRWAALRFVSVVALFAFYHLWGFTLALLQGAVTLSGRLGGSRLERWSYWLQDRWVISLFGGIRRLTGFTILEENPEALPKSGPVLLFLRHASAIDTLLPVVLVSGPLSLFPRYVLKSELLWDPCFDVIGNRMKNVFVARGSSDPAQEIENIRDLATSLGPKDIAVIYPEGTRRTPERRARILDRMRERGDARLAFAESLAHTLPPKHGGALALLEAAEDTEVVFCGHVGLEDAFDFADLLNGLLVGKTVRVRYWHFSASDVPDGPAERADWLDVCWRTLDEWVGYSDR